MKTSLLRRLFVVVLTAVCCLAIHAAQPAEWTVMVYLNGDNNLEYDALRDFAEIAKVGSSKDVNVVVQFDRQNKAVDDEINWGTTLRYYMTQGIKPTLSAALADIHEQDMGDGQTLLDFVRWAQSNYQAKRYCLIIWDHGQGWRFLKPARRAFLAVQLRDKKIAGPLVEQILSVSTDYGSSMDQLYNREMADALEKLDGKIDVLGFDACLMGMIESAYAFRGCAKVMVGSEEEELGSGWQHDLWLRDLVDNPTMSAEILGESIVNAFALANSNLSTVWTLSAVAVDKVDPLAQRTTELAKALMNALTIAGQVDKIADARAAAYAYGQSQGVDLGYFCEKLRAQCQLDSAVEQAARNVQDAIADAVILSRAGSARQHHYGSYGLAIYFPENGHAFAGDSESKAYLESNTFNVVKFVKDHQWDNFLQAYYKLRP